MNPLKSGGHVLVLSSRRAFEALAGPIPAELESRFRFQKPANVFRIRLLLSRCRLLVSKNYRRPQCNRWIFEARRRGIPTLLMVDGPLEWANSYLNPKTPEAMKAVSSGLYEPIIHDAVATIGEAQSKWIEARNAGRKIEFMTYANHRILTDDSGSTSRSEPEFDFLITTAKTPYFGIHEKAALSKVLRECAVALERGGYRTLVRIFDDALRSVVHEAAPGSTFDQRGSSAEAIAKARCVVGTPSSVILEAMHHDKPTGLLMFRDHPSFYHSGWRLERGQEWQATFRSMRDRDPTRMERQRNTLGENLAHDSFFSHCERIAEGEFLAAPRPLDLPDLEFERQTRRTLQDERRPRLSEGCRCTRPRTCGIVRP